MSAFARLLLPLAAAGHDVAYTGGAYSMAYSVVQSTDSGGRSVLYFVDEVVNQVLRVHPSLPGPSSSPVLCGVQQVIAAGATSPQPQRQPQPQPQQPNTPPAPPTSRKSSLDRERTDAPVPALDAALGSGDQQTTVFGRKVAGNRSTVFTTPSPSKSSSEALALLTSLKCIFKRSAIAESHTQPME